MKRDDRLLRALLLFSAGLLLSTTLVAAPGQTQSDLHSAVSAAAVAVRLNLGFGSIINFQGPQADGGGGKTGTGGKTPGETKGAAETGDGDSTDAKQNAEVADKGSGKTGKGGMPVPPDVKQNAEVADKGSGKTGTGGKTPGETKGAAETGDDHSTDATQNAEVADKGPSKTGTGGKTGQAKGAAEAGDDHSTDAKQNTEVADKGSGKTGTGGKTPGESVPRKVAARVAEVVLFPVHALGR